MSFVWLILLTGGIFAKGDLMASDVHHISRDEVTDVNPSECLDSVSRLDLKYFRYAFDEFRKNHFGNRKEIGVLAQDAISVVPESVAAISELLVDADANETSLKNFLVLDPETVF